MFSYNIHVPDCTKHSGLFNSHVTLFRFINLIKCCNKEKSIYLCTYNETCK